MLKDFFSTPEKPVSNSEMMEYWKALSDEEKEFHRNMPLDK